MMDRQHGKYIFTCDTCEEVLETDADEFGEAISILRDNGWRSRKFEGGWEHYCEQCRP